MFNEANPTEKVELIQKMMDVRYIFVCAYDDDCVGLFEKSIGVRIEVNMGIV